jgi:hypothetical protein
MAATKTRSPNGRTSSKPKRSKPRKASTTRKAKVGARKASAKKAPQRKAPSSNGAGAVKNGTETAKKARKAVESTAKQAGSAVSDAGHSVGKAASKAKTPLIAGGAAVAGAAGGLALAARQARKSKTLRRPKVKIRSQDLARAARDVGQFGMDVGQLAGELRKNREAANGAKHRSPIEVVLQGLTSRGHND